MPAKSKLSPKARKVLMDAEDKLFKRQAIVATNGESASVSANGTKVSGAYMQKSDGSFYIRETERRSRKTLVMKWRKLNA